MATAKNKENESGFEIEFLKHSFVSHEYWDNHYDNTDIDDEFYEWYLGYKASIKTFFEQFLNINSSTKGLMLGCGTSQITNCLNNQFHCYLVNVDFSNKAIEHMKNLHLENPKLIWVNHNVCDLHSIANSEFDFIFDKGTLDTIVCSTSWKQQIPKMFLEAARVGKDESILIIISTHKDVYKFLSYSYNYFNNQQIFNNNNNDDNNNLKFWKNAIVVCIDSNTSCEFIQLSQQFKSQSFPITNEMNLNENHFFNFANINATQPDLLYILIVSK
eukprot:TRINITY_DN1702_c0_g2_i1.p1 TRINITY_DN1702_c0_g2~~TRINITY_DN1702_c0_g2_i1.p1  ORF type:complete len:273 (-),score=99.30 TRINITY_DN1702_c0_g2_i1:4-822(-)